MSDEKERSKAELITTIIMLVIKYGVPAAIEAIKLWKVDIDNITLADIRELGSKIHKDDEFIKIKEDHI